MSLPFLVNFPNQNAVIAKLQSLEQIPDAIAIMNVAINRPVLVVIGGASKISDADYELIQQLFTQVLAPLAQQWQAAVIDGGTDAGVMRLIGQARCQIQGTFPLIGVAPIGLTTLPGEATPSKNAAPLEPNHSNFLLVPGSDWGDESHWLATVATSIAHSAPSVTVLINGGEITWEDASQNLAGKRPLIVISGSGRTADLIAAGLRGEPTDERALPLIQSGQVQAIDLTDLAKLRGTIESVFAEQSTPLN
ncbi:MAG: hypothetical protein MUC48_12405 [Leptolyngbya sp. Prado105]|jgi:hypothetical protein|nr:hypothetical protein [Leptolyngbya sp. Prado105]